MPSGTSKHKVGLGVGSLRSLRYLSLSPEGRMDGQTDQAFYFKSYLSINNSIFPISNNQKPSSPINAGFLTRIVQSSTVSCRATDHSILVGFVRTGQYKLQQ